MNQSVFRLFASLLLCLAVTVSFAQTSINPDISVIPRFKFETNDLESVGTDRREFSRPNFTFEELELVFSSYLNPFAKADLVLTLPGPDVEAGKLGLEELYATIVRGLPFDANLRVGKYRAEYGKLNLLHPHSWPFVTTDLSQERFLGEEGLNDLGVSASVLLPTGKIYSRITVDLLRGHSVGEAAGIEDTTGANPLYANSARLMSFYTLTDYSDLEVGLSAFTGIHDPYHRDRFWYTGIDFKYKYKPSAYTSLTIQGEGLLNTRKAEQDRNFNSFVNEHGLPERRSISTKGFYIFIDYQFSKIFSIGAKYGYSETPYSDAEKARAVSMFLGYYPVEETLGVRLEYQNTKYVSPSSTYSTNSIALQLLFSMGPHKAHPF